MAELVLSAKKIMPVCEILTRIYKKDSLLYYHCAGVARLTKIAVDYLKFGNFVDNYQIRFDRDLAITAASIHDEGKLGVSDEVLKRSDFGGFNRDGNDGLRMFYPHVEKGFRDLRANKFLTKEAEIVALHHFPDYYPKGIFNFPVDFTSEDISDVYYCARLLHIIDDYQAATTRKNGRKV